MELHTFPSRFPYSPAQQGAALLIFMAVLLIGAGVTILGSLRTGDTQHLADQKTADALAQAKVALIGYAVADPNRPGELPCPDFNNDGDSIPVEDYSGSNCKSLIGWLPWKLLRLPDLRDGSGERLWYAIANNFHANGTTPLNSTVSGALSITGSQPASNVVAIVFAAGAPVPGQVRPTLPGTFVANTDVAKYLEANNALSAANVNFVTGNNTAVFNDRLLPISHDELFGVVNKRIAAEIGKGLQAYFVTQGDYPLAANNRTAGAVPTAGITYDTWLSSENWLTAGVSTYSVSNDQAQACIRISQPATMLSLGGRACP